jgi:probable rRNA maturation factor
VKNHDKQVQIISVLSSWKINNSAVEKLILHYLKKLGYPNSGISVMFCADQRIKSLNKKFRNKNETTDILSFPEDKKIAGIWLGDLAINLPYCYRKGLRFGLDFKEEIAFLLVHGLLHLAGFHHDTVKQQKIHDLMVGDLFPPNKKLIKNLRFLRCEQ